MVGKIPRLAEALFLVLCCATATGMYIDSSKYMQHLEFPLKGRVLLDGGPNNLRALKTESEDVTRTEYESEASSSCTTQTAS